jgi:hypothetical protein
MRQRIEIIGSPKPKARQLNLGRKEFARTNPLGAVDDSDPLDYFFD